MLSGNEVIKEYARSTIGSFAASRTGPGPEDEVAEKNAQDIEETLISVWWVFLRDFCQRREDVKFKNILEHCANQGPQISKLDIVGVNAPLEMIDSKIFALRERFHTDSHGITRQFPDEQFDILSSEWGLVDSLSNPLKYRFIRPCWILRNLHSSLTELISRVLRDGTLDTEEILSSTKSNTYTATTAVASPRSP